MGNKGTFLIHMIARQNASWQGTITWLEKRETERFRSMLELIRLIDSAVDEEEETASLMEQYRMADICQSTDSTRLEKVAEERSWEGRE